MAPKHKLYYSVLFSVLGYICSIVLLKTFNVYIGEYGYYGISFIVITRLLYKRIEKLSLSLSLSTYFLFNFISTSVLILGLNYLI